MHSPKLSILRLAGLMTCLAILAVPVVAGSQDKKQKPSIRLNANPSAGFSPLRVVVSASLQGGADDYKEFYCPSIEWAWGDDTTAETTADCEPYEAGKSQIKRRYSISRVFRTSGQYRVAFRLKQNDKVVGSGTTTVLVRPGAREGMGCCD